MNNRKKTVLIFGIAVYVYILLSIILFKYISPLELFKSDRIIYNGCNLVLFKDLYNHRASASYNFNSIFGNIILFIPFGIYMTMKNDKVIRNVLYSFMLSLFFESFQYYFKIGSFDVNDLLLNTIGGIVGILFYKCLKGVLKKRKANDFIIYSAMVVGVIVVIISVLLYI
ncbi:MAG: VanZ family protein [Tissierellia bacterium]|nr:VanZ family protein [Tissierellia bacterium]